MSRREEEVRNCAVDVLEELSLSTLPIDPDEIAASKGLSVEEKSGFPEGVYGALYKQGNRFGIFLSSACPTRGHRNFSLAHEVGHFHIDGHVDAFFRNGDGLVPSLGGHFRSTKDRHEREADWFASELLAPTGLVQPRILSAEPGVKSLSTLAQDCRVSLSMMAIRYAELSDLAVAAVLSHEGSVEWTACSKPLREHPWWRQLRRNTEVMRPTATAALARDPSAVLRGDQRSSIGHLCEWFEGAPGDLEVEEDAVGLGPFGRVLTLLVVPNLLDPEEAEEQSPERDDPADWRDALRGYEMD